MIVCSCNFISEEEIREAIMTLNKEKPTANCVMTALGSQLICATCAKSIKEQIRKHNESLPGSL